MASEKGRRFSHLSWTDRLKIAKMLKEGFSKQEIADALHVHNSTIYREIRRGLVKQMDTYLREYTAYSPELADRKYRDNLAAKGPELKIGNDHELAAFLEKMILEEKHSPAAALYEIKLQNKHFKTTISEWTLYSYIAKGVFANLSSGDLPNGGAKQKHDKVRRAARAPKGESIEQRPEEISERKEVGHWEMDTVESGKGSRKRLLVLTERASRKELLFLMKDGTAASVVYELNRLEEKLGADNFRKIFKSITVDNGSEFADYEGIRNSCNLNEEIRTRVFYCHPYRASERGSNENQNRLIRRWYPNGMVFENLTGKSVKAVESWINNYPRDLFRGMTSNIIYKNLLAEAGLPELAAAC